MSQFTSTPCEKVVAIDLKDFTFEFYLEWRPGYPDYSDAQVFSSDTGAFSGTKGDGTKPSPTRRLKVAR